MASSSNHHSTDPDILEVANRRIDRYLPSRIHVLKTLPCVVLWLFASAYIPHTLNGTPQTYADGIFVLKLVFFFLILVAPYTINAWEDRPQGSEAFRFAMVMLDTGCSGLYILSGSSESDLRVITAVLWNVFCDTVALVLVLRSVFRARPPGQTEEEVYEVKVALKGVNVEPV
ncbi:hypothetical protein MKEN_01281900 [Mycena kentingensis (nom. inval.)]|nr:hypothetical protein MKEN_01281900 [Mycena kentingensis (nom. inval.)]